MKYYQESEEVNWLKAASFFVVFCGCIVLFSHFYNLVNNFIPIVYINCFITIGYGYLLGLLIRTFPFFGHIRSKKVSLVFSLIFSTFAIYTAWVDYLVFVTNDFQPAFLTYLNELFEWPFTESFWLIIKEINETGIWSLGLRENIPVNGWLLSCVWIGEMLILLGFPFIQMRKVHTVPYSETSRNFYNKFIIDKEFESFYSSKKFNKEMTASLFELLKSVDDGNAMRHSKISIYHHPNENKAYFDVDRVYFEGRSRPTKKTIQIEGVREISSSDADRVLKVFDNTIDRISVIFRF